MYDRRIFRRERIRNYHRHDNSWTFADNSVSIEILLRELWQVGEPKLLGIVIQSTSGADTSAVIDQMRRHCSDGWNVISGK